MVPSFAITFGLCALCAVALAFVVNLLLPETYKSPRNYAWFMGLRRPAWLTFERLIPVIWISIFLCGIGSAAWLWEQDPPQAGWWMVAYAALEIIILAYMPALCGLRSLRIGAMVGLTGWLLGGILTLLVASFSLTAAALLVPYLLWSPIGTYVTWEMIRLNPDQE